MSINQRPTCITVIGWFWVISGGLACFGAIGAVFSFVMIGKMSQAHPEALQNMSAIFRFIPVLAPVQVGVGILGIVSGINFLKLKPWARAIVEVLAWLLLLYVLLFGIWFLTQLWG
jgi:hypothetical protein